MRGRSLQASKVCRAGTEVANLGHVLGKLGAANRTEVVVRARELNLL